MADCPQCGNEIKTAGRCACGWKAVPEKKNGNPYKYGIQIGSDWFDKGCVWDDHGYRCGAYGSCSTATNGEGPWYCSDHFAKVMRWN